MASTGNRSHYTLLSLNDLYIDNKMPEKVGITLTTRGSSDYEASNFLSKESLSWRLANDPDLLACVHPLKGAATRSFDNDKWPMLVTIFNVLGFSLDDVYSIDKNPNIVLMNVTS